MTKRTRSNPRGEVVGGRYDTVDIYGPSLKYLRMQAKLTQRQLADLAAPLAGGYLSNIERQAQARVSRSAATRIAAALGINIESLLGPFQQGTNRLRQLPSTEEEDLALITKNRDDYASVVDPIIQNSVIRRCAEVSKSTDQQASSHN